ncbi:MAG: ATP-binding protein [Synergistaceae bacterium]|jgi:sigma-B regulation protein RsbU (phosphoserine phosphatase)|nr:ATP-binding protein [Synergistaceae bacterium]
MERAETIRFFRADIRQMSEVYSFVAQTLADCGVPAKYSPIMEMAADEIFSNITKYAYEDDEDKNAKDAVIVGLTVKDGAIELRFGDRGIPFDPLSFSPADTVSGTDEREPGGLGIYLTRSAMDDARYAREGGRNVLTLVKFIGDKVGDKIEDKYRR